MELLIGFVIFVFLGFLLFVSFKTEKRITSVSDFLSFGHNHHQSTLRKTFEGTNISYGMIFIAFMIYPSSYGWATIAIPIGFIAGIILFVTLFVPKLMDNFANNIRFPELLERTTQSIKIRKLTAVLAVISLWIFTFAEVQAVGSLVSETLHLNELQAIVVVASVVVCLMFYVVKGGYQTMLETDQVQMNITYLGSFCLVIIIVMQLNQVGLTVVIGAVANHQGLLTTKIDYAVFIAEAFSGFLLAQLYYYDNWQRLTAYVKSEVEQSGDSDIFDRQHFERLQNQIRSSYLRGTLVIGFVILLPLMLGFLLIVDGSAVSPVTYLVGLLQQTWQGYQIIGPIMVLMVVLLLVSSLMSTVDSYTIGAANIIYEDILGRGTTSERLSDLKLIKMVVVLFLAVIILLLPVKPDFATLLLYLIYSANGFVGPILFSILRKSVSHRAVLASILFGFSYPVATLYFPDSTFAQIPGIMTLTVSIALVGLWRVEKQAIGH